MVSEMRFDPRHRMDPSLYYERFWNLQYDEYHAWRDGFVSDDMFKYWLTMLRNKWLTNGTVVTELDPKKPKPVTYREGFDYVVPTWGSSRFGQVMSALHEGGVEAAFDVARQLSTVKDS